jgi:hypothetical protein
MAGVRGPVSGAASKRRSLAINCIRVDDLLAWALSFGSRPKFLLKLDWIWPVNPSDPQRPILTI